MILESIAVKSSRNLSGDILGQASISSMDKMARERLLA
jgi:hypothetical protein